jgi:DNA-binding MarR family transcriptional regulator
MDPIKESFNRVKEDIAALKVEMEEMKKSLIDLCHVLEKMVVKGAKPTTIEPLTNNQELPAYTIEIPTNQQIIPTHFIELPLETASKHLLSTGNRGVPTDRQTHQQTDRQPENSIENAAEMLKSLDAIKKEIRQKFKKLTEQEWLVFSTIYQFDEEKGCSDYKTLAERLNLTESSIRDYVGKLIKKGIPVDKIKQNNKNISLNISQSLKQVASLPTIIALRDM